MLTSILVGLDGSPSSAAAVELSIQWAKRFNALLIGLGIVDVTAAIAPQADAVEGGYYAADIYENLFAEAGRVQGRSWNDLPRGVRNRTSPSISCKTRDSPGIIPGRRRSDEEVFANRGRGRVPVD